MEVLRNLIDMVSREQKKQGGLARSDKAVEKPRVDLGFSNLVASLNTPPQQEKNAPQAADVPNPQPVESKTLSGSTTPSNFKTKQTLEMLVLDKNWLELEVEAEKEMSAAKGGARTAATIWWALANLELGKIPVSVLIPPVDKASADIERFTAISSGALVEPVLSSPLLRKECAAVLLRMAKRSISSLGEASAPDFLRRAAALNNELSSEIKGVLEREVDRLQKMTGRKDLREARIKSLQSIVSGLSSSSSSAMKPSRKDGVAQNGFGVRESAKSDLKNDLRIEPKQKKSTKSVFLALCMALIIAGGFFIHHYGLLTSSVASAKGEAELMQYSSKPESTYPKIERFQSIDNLEVLLAKVNSLAVPNSQTRSPALGRHNNAVITSEPASPQVEMGELVPSNRKARDIKNTKEIVDTSGPLEGTQFYEREMRQVGTPGGDSVFGSAPPGVGGLMPNSAGGPKVYRVLTFTRVYMKASFFSQNIANLDSGARVEVVERFGEWLKIRSKGGQVGFMLAQDAEEIR